MSMALQCHCKEQRRGETVKIGDAGPQQVGFCVKLVFCIFLRRENRLHWMIGLSSAVKNQRLESEGWAMSSDSAGSLIKALSTVFFLSSRILDSLLAVILHIYPSDVFYKPMRCNRGDT